MPSKNSIKGETMNNYNIKLKIGSDIFQKNFSLMAPSLNKQADHKQDDNDISLESLVLDYNIRYYSHRNATFVIEMDNIKLELIDTIADWLITAIDNCLFQYINVEFDVSQTESKEYVKNMIAKLQNKHIANSICFQVNAYINKDEKKEAYEFNNIKTIYHYLGIKNDDSRTGYSYLPLEDIAREEIDVNTIDMNNTIITTDYPREVENELLNEVVYNRMNNAHIREIVRKIHRGSLFCRAALPFYFVISPNGTVRKCKHYENGDTIIGYIADGTIVIDNTKYSKWVFLSIDEKCRSCYLFPACMGMACPRLNIINEHNNCPKEKQLIDSMLEE